MADNHSREERSFNMSRIRSKDTNPELVVRRFLFSNGFRYRLHKKELPGKPDIVLGKYKVAIFIHGCFWHHHDHCKYAILPKSNTEYWIPKIEKNRLRDAANISSLKRLGWKILVIWECELKPKTVERALDQLLKYLFYIKNKN